MSGITTYAQTQFGKVFQGTSLTAPAALYLGLIYATRGYWAASTAYAVGDTIVPATPNGHFYKCTTAGTSGASAPTWGTVSGGTTTDGGAVWTEQDAALDGMTSAAPVSEVAGAGYARVPLAPSAANWPLSAVGSNQKVATGAQVTFGSPTAAWGLVIGAFVADAASGAGNVWFWEMLTTPQYVNANAPAPYIPAGSASLQIDG